jgi:hypothetical protein
MVVAYTYDDQARREDLLDVMRNIRPLETRLVSGLGVSQAKNTLHEWVIKALSSVAVNAQIEGADASYRTLSNPTRVNNITQIFSRGYQVSDTERAINMAGFNDRFALEATDALIALKNDMELALMRGSLGSGSGSAARTLRGIKNSVSLLCVNSSVSLSEAMLNNYFQTVWTEGAEVNAVYVGMTLKRRITGFTAGTTKYTDVTDKTLYNIVDVYESDAAKVVKLFPHRYVNLGTDTTFDVVAVDENYFKTAYLRKPTTEELSKTGDSTKGQVVSELTMESHPYAGIWSKGLL